MSNRGNRHKFEILACQRIAFIFLISVVLCWFLFFVSFALNDEHKTNTSKSMRNYNFMVNGVVCNVSQIKQRIYSINRLRKISNEDKFGNYNNYSLVILIQVHNRMKYLRHLIDSFRNASDIANVLLIFSHDFFDESINGLIRAIHFCKVLQIFYPYSGQLYPNKFPGFGPTDCSPHLSTAEAILKKCSNAFYTDIAGNYRNPHVTQIKHHWWWKANTVFGLPSLREYGGLFLFLEEDFYVLEDFIHILKLIGESCRTCKIISLAAKGEPYEWQKFVKIRNTALVTNAVKHLAFAINRETWFEVVNCKDFFCFYDDYNWDYSLQHVFAECINNSTSVTIDTPRVFHLGVCGLHASNENCTSTLRLSRIKSTINQHRHFLYPKKLYVVHKTVDIGVSTAFGGWGDPRDHALCLGMAAK